ncbi:hypothetical protein HPP92_027175 [Vanilla planifolia]|uniref:Uncharacterized protein n=1 Tax=Vanilla planifolia TaxID=51239 RepID=A0A835PC17_VANPL|nr:hypothetical protein HPP92_027175 [Vanilla planifolia]
MVERLVLGPRISGAVEIEFRRSEQKNAPQFGWAGMMAAAGFGAVALSYFNLCQAKLMLDLFNFGYLVEEEAENKLVLYWKSLRLVSASVWSAPPPSTAASAMEVP